MYKKKKFSEDEIKKANEVSILSLVKSLGLKMEKKRMHIKLQAMADYSLMNIEINGIVLLHNSLEKQFMGVDLFNLCSLFLDMILSRQ